MNMDGTEEDRLFKYPFFFYIIKKLKAVIINAELCSKVTVQQP